MPRSFSSRMLAPDVALSSVVACHGRCSHTLTYVETCHRFACDKHSGSKTHESGACLFAAPCSDTSANATDLRRLGDLGVARTFKPRILSEVAGLRLREGVELALAYQSNHFHLFHSSRCLSLFVVVLGCRVGRVSSTSCASRPNLQPMQTASLLLLLAFQIESVGTCPFLCSYICEGAGLLC